MSRIVSVWLPRWPILRFLAAQTRNPSSAAPVDPERPFVLAVEISGGARIAALNRAAEAEGLRPGDRLADARARVDFLQARFVDAAADDEALRRLALWATRYAPVVSVWNERSRSDGLFLDITGSAHLFGGEEALLADLSRRLRRFGLTPRIAVADTAGAAWALSRCHAKSIVILPSGCQGEALAPFPVEALRLSPETSDALRRLGFKRIGLLLGAARAPFAARFEKELLNRLDQALGREVEPLLPVERPPVYARIRRLLEPIFAQAMILIVASQLMEEVAPELVRDGVGARALRLTLYRVSGEIEAIDIGLSAPTLDPAHIVKLFALKFERMTETVEADFGFDAVALSVLAAERMDPRQIDLAAVSNDANEQERCNALIDSLKQRLGPKNVYRLRPIESHRPERAEAAHSITLAWPAPDETHWRPSLLLPRAEAVNVMSVPPNEAPRRFIWRGGAHAVAHLQGPERIAGEWWRDVGQAARDYHVVEDDSGRRFWLYCEGDRLHDAPPRWFMHGLFA